MWVSLVTLSVAEGRRGAGERGSRACEQNTEGNRSPGLGDSESQSPLGPHSDFDAAGVIECFSRGVHGSEYPATTSATWRVITESKCFEKERHHSRAVYPCLVSQPCVERGSNDCAALGILANVRSPGDRSLFKKDNICRAPGRTERGLGGRGPDETVRGLWHTETSDHGPRACLSEFGFCGSVGEGQCEASIGCDWEARLDCGDGTGDQNPEIRMAASCADHQKVRSPCASLPVLRGVVQPLGAAHDSRRCET